MVTPCHRWIPSINSLLVHFSWLEDVVQRGTRRGDPERQLSWRHFPMRAWNGHLDTCYCILDGYTCYCNPDYTCYWIWNPAGYTVSVSSVNKHLSAKDASSTFNLVLAQFFNLVLAQPDDRIQNAHNCVLLSFLPLFLSDCSPRIKREVVTFVWLPATAGKLSKHNPQSGKCSDGKRKTRILAPHWYNDETFSVIQEGWWCC